LKDSFTYNGDTDPRPIQRANHRYVHMSTLTEYPRLGQFSQFSCSILFSAKKTWIGRGNRTLLVRVLRMSQRTFTPHVSFHLWATVKCTYNRIG